MANRPYWQQSLSSEGVVTSTVTLPSAGSTPEAWPVGEWSAFDFDSITPSDDALAKIPRAVFCGGAGNLVVRKIGGSTSVTFAVQAGQTLPICPEKIMAATTATGIVVLY